MFKVNDKVSHPGHGACEVIAVCKQDFSGKEEMYYQLMPMVDAGAVVYVPVNNAEKIGLRPLISPDQADGLLHSLQDNASTWISDVGEKQRLFRELFADNDVEKMYDCMTALSAIVRQNEKKSLGNVDKEILRIIQTKTVSEIAMAKGLSLQSTLEHIDDIILNPT